MGSENDNSVREEINNNKNIAFFNNEKNINLLIEKTKCLIKIRKDDAYIGNGFFCKIPYPDKLNLLTVMIAPDFILKKEELIPGAKIYIKLNINNLHFNLKIIIDNSRKIYTNSKYYITIVEIKKDEYENFIDNNSFLEIDDDIFNDDLNIYINKQILYLVSNDKFSFSCGVIKSINGDIIEHSCSTEFGSSGCPIITSSNAKVIGIQLLVRKNYNVNTGIFLKEPIKEFYERNRSRINNYDINTLINYLNEEKNKNKELNKKIKELTKNLENAELLLKKERQITAELNIKLNNLKALSNNDDNNIKKALELMENLKLKEKEIKEIKSRYPIELLKGEYLMSVIFISLDQRILYSEICKNTDQFSKLESQLYKQYPQYLENENYFIANGIKINRFKTLEENGIRNHNIITLRPFNDI